MGNRKLECLIERQQLESRYDLFDVEAGDYVGAIVDRKTPIHSNILLSQESGGSYKGHFSSYQKSIENLIKDLVIFQNCHYNFDITEYDLSRIKEIEPCMYIPRGMPDNFYILIKNNSARSKTIATSFASVTICPEIDIFIKIGSIESKGDDFYGIIETSIAFINGRNDKFFDAVKDAIEPDMVFEQPIPEYDLSIIEKSSDYSYKPKNLSFDIDFGIDGHNNEIFGHVNYRSMIAENLTIVQDIGHQIWRREDSDFDIFLDMLLDYINSEVDKPVSKDDLDLSEFTHAKHYVHELKAPSFIVNSVGNGKFEVIENPVSN